MSDYDCCEGCGISEEDEFLEECEICGGLKCSSCMCEEEDE